MKKNLVFLLLCLILCFSYCIAHASLTPSVVPTLKQWENTDGYFSFSSLTGIRAAKELSATAAILQEQISQDYKTKLPVSETSGNLVLLIYEKSMPTDGYELTIAESGIRIEAATSAGVFYGTQTLIQMLHGEGKKLPCGIATDWADYPQRGSHLDVGRKYFTMDWIFDHIRTMAYYKYNILHLHFTDSEGWRIQCDTYPEIVTEPYYTKAQVQQIIDYARARHIEVIPEIDMPGHMATVIHAHPELALPGSAGVSLDLGNDASYTFVENLLKEYVPLFPGRYFHCGMDEYLTAEEYPNFPSITAYAQKHYGTSDGQIVYYRFIQFANEIVNCYGKTMRIWSDGIHPNAMNILSRNIIIDCWDRPGTAMKAADLIAEGFTVVNSNASFLYYVLSSGGTNASDNRDKDIFDGWTPDNFIYNEIIHSEKNLGGIHHVWCDYPDVVTIETIADEISDEIRIVGQKNWNKSASMSYEQFQKHLCYAGNPPGQLLHGFYAPSHDLARFAPTTASHEFIGTTEQIWTADKATDGDPATRWSTESTNGAPGWIQVDLRLPHRITGIKLLWEAAYATSYEIAVSSDGITWQTIYTKQNADGGTDNISGLYGIGRYVRLTGFSSAFASNYSLYDMQIYGDCLLPNVAFGASVTADAHYNDGTLVATPDRLTDNNENTRWAVEPTQIKNQPMELVITLKEKTPIHAITLVWEAAFASDYTISVSDDRISWQTIYTQTAGSGGRESLYFENAAGKYIKLSLKKRGTVYGYSLYEVYVYGFPAICVKQTSITPDTSAALVYACEEGTCIAAAYNAEGALLLARQFPLSIGDNRLVFSMPGADHTALFYLTKDNILTPTAEKTTLLK